MNILLLCISNIRVRSLLSIINKPNSLIPLSQFRPLVQDIHHSLFPAHNLPCVFQPSFDQLPASTPGLLSRIDRDQAEQDLFIAWDSLRGGVIKSIGRISGIMTEIWVVFCRVELKGSENFVGFGIKGEEDRVDGVGEDEFYVGSRDTVFCD